MSADVSAWVQALSSDDLAARREAAEKLSRCAEEARPAAVPLVRASGDTDDVVREFAVATLEGLGPPAVEEVASLAQLVNTESAEVGYWACTLLGRLGEKGAGAVPLLAAAVASHPQASVRQRSAWALGKIGPAARTAAEILRTAAASGDARLVRLATQALQEIGS